MNQLCSLRVATGHENQPALVLVKETLRNVSLERLPIDKYIISKSLAANYKGDNIPHVSAWNRMKSRSEPDCPSVGGRMAFVYTKGTASLAARAEHPAFVAKSKLKLDTSYYIQASKNPITKLLQFSSNLDEIFRDAQNLADSRNTHTLIDFEEQFVCAPPKKKKGRTSTPISLDDFLR